MDFQVAHIYRTAPTTLYHYASHEAALGIMTSGAVWATHLAYLNDQQELHHALRLFRRRIEESRRTVRSAPVAQLLEHMLHSLDGVAVSDIGVFSLSEESDSLSQWRGYCPRGVGYALGFDSAALAAAVTEQRAQLGACVYDREIQHAVIDQVIANTIDVFQGALDESRIDHEELVAEHRIRFMADAASVAAYIKHDAFAEEREWRLVSRFAGETETRWSFRSGPVSMIPYLPLPVAEADADVRLNSVVVGPSPDATAALRSGRLFFASRGLHAHSVQGSRIPFRSW